ncbi:hypothetical protein BTM25_54970 [Actinomadura rubteroloni]|uniref:Acyl-CoA carboxylase subunit epsilon n=1 Tax=Actinomadura rubteroloni TaxID=1926885 RepID=A0A2P4UBY1_9ACTN|nr:acyl-CoA carboxylase epsilon subunit [Actinomadura rubteroloni]POM22547.1 hypothetical protein BTM25_54970 [Actinomadura rubteroloni]
MTPEIRVVRGAADADDLAALTVVLLALRRRAATGAEPPRRAPRAVWRHGDPGYVSPTAWAAP